MTVSVEGAVKGIATAVATNGTETAAFHFDVLGQNDGLVCKAVEKISLTRLFRGSYAPVRA